MMEPEALKWHRFETFANEWEHFGSISRPPSFFKDEQGRVFLSGTITNGRPDNPGGTRSKVCDLPEGFRPIYAAHFSVANSTRTEDGDEAQTAILIVRPDGEIIVKNAHPGWLTMDGAIIFTTEELA
jgi:hypothetical protein